MPFLCDSICVGHHSPERIQYLEWIPLRHPLSVRLRWRQKLQEDEPQGD